MDSSPQTPSDQTEGAAEERKYLRDSKGKFIPGTAAGPALAPGAPRDHHRQRKALAVREGYIEAFDRLGGVDGLVQWASRSDKNRGTFYKFVAGFLPRMVEVTGPGGTPLRSEALDAVMERFIGALATHAERINERTYEGGANGSAQSGGDARGADRGDGGGDAVSGVREPDNGPL